MLTPAFASHPSDSHPRARRPLGTLLFALAALALGACGGGGSPPEGDSGVPPDPDACLSVTRPLLIPFEFAFASDHLDVATPGGPLAVMVGPWGAHVQPHTGHPEGNVKADWYGLFTPTHTSPGLVQVAYGSGAITQGGCAPGARCGVLTTDLLARRPSYRFPADSVTVTRVELLAIHSADPLDGMAWEVEVELCPYRYVFGHVQGIPDGLAEALVAAGAPDPRVAPSVGFDFVAGRHVVVPAGTNLAYPQIRSSVIADAPAYRTGVDSVPDVPWVQIEWTALDRATSESGVATPEPDLLTSSDRQALASILDAQVDTDEFRYAPVPRWLWAAEHVLVATPPFVRNVQNGLTDGLGGWSQRPESGVCDPRPYDTPECAETFAVFPIHHEGAHYDPKLYRSEDVQFLVYRGRYAGAPTDFHGFGEVLSPAIPDETSGELIVLWRHAFSEELQRIGYRLDPDTGRLRVRYGATLDATGDPPFEKVPPVVVPSASDPCTPDGTICMTAPSYGRF